MRDHGAFGFGIQHAIEYQIIGVDRLACHLLNRFGAQMAVTDCFVIVDRIRDMRRLLDRFACPQGLRRGENGILNGWIARATAKRILQRKTNILAVWIRIALEQGIRGHDLAGDAKSALDCAMFHEGFLQRVQFHLFVNALGQVLRW